jgi:hypothetical protein
MSRKKKGKITLRKIGQPEPATAAGPEVSNDLIRERRSEIARLRAQGADVNVDKRTSEILGAWRRDVFTIPQGPARPIAARLRGFPGPRDRHSPFRGRVRRRPPA